MVVVVVRGGKVVVVVDSGGRSGGSPPWWGATVVMEVVLPGREQRWKSREGREEGRGNGLSGDGVNLENVSRM